MIQAIQGDKKVKNKLAGELGAASFGANQPLALAPAPANPGVAVGLNNAQDRVSISAEAREKENLQGLRRVNLESWALGLGSQSPNQVQKQQGVSANLAAPEKPKLDTIQRGADLNSPTSAAINPDLNAIDIGEARAAQVVKNTDASRRTTSFVIDYEAPVITRESA